VCNHPVWSQHRICLQQHLQKQTQLQLMLDLMSCLWTRAVVPVYTIVQATQILGLKVVVQVQGLGTQA
jgi:hypothetical protein